MDVGNNLSSNVSDDVSGYHTANPDVYYAVAAKESGKIVLWLGEYICKDSAEQRKREVEPLFATHVDVEVLEFTI